jgi:LysM repeat protein
MHRVGAGETLASVGKLFGTTANVIMTANNLRSPEAVEGDRLLIPVALRAEAPARPAVSRTPIRRTTATAPHRIQGKTPAARPVTSVKPPSKPPVIVARSAAQ